MDLRAITLAVLAGGRGERMGGPKSALQIGGVAILQYLLERLRWPGPTLLVTGIGNEQPPGHELFNHEVTDAVAGEGPLRGVLTALDGATTDRAVAVTVDMPAITREQIQWLLDQTGDREVGMMSRVIDGVARIEPFPCILRTSARERIKQRLETGRRSVHGLGEDAGAVLAAPASWAEEVWINLNRPEDLRQIHLP
jgi:molybdopterin-guanine dinucleotide biosynthesis protein A